MSKSNQQLVIFDFDGVIVDSETISVDLLIAEMSQHGLDLTANQAYDAFLGKQVAKADQSVMAAFGIEVPPLDEAAFKAKLFQLFDAQLKPISGILGAYNAIKGQRCIASSSSMDRILRSLAITGLDTVIDCIKFGAGTVSRGKPAPDLFLHAATHHGVRPENCIVVEDSPAGISAALAAGMKCIGFVGGSHATPASLKAKLAELGPNLIIETMSQLPEAIINLSKQETHIS
jgi:HAD superfamily hydrolase (TIGR01509 family)